MEAPSLRAALGYAERGWAVIPIQWIDEICSCANPFCEAAGKHPLTKHGSRDASKDPEVIRQWWKQWPRANVAIVAGEISNLLILDLDVNDEGKDGRQEIREFIFREQLTLPPTLSQETGGGGQHLFFEHAEGVKSVPGWLPGVDIRSTGTYVLAAPSSHASGGTYRWANDEDVASLSDRMIEILRQARGGHSSRGGRDIGSSPPPAYDYRKAVLDGPERGYRDHFFNAHAFTLRKRGLTDWEAVAALNRIYEVMSDKTDFSFDTVIDKVNRIWATVDYDPEVEMSTWKPAEVESAPEVEDNPNYVHPDHTFDDLGNARRLVSTYGHLLLYSGAVGWLIWSNTHWKRDTTDRIYRATQVVVNNVEEQAQRATDEQVREKLFKHAARSRSEKALRSAVNLAKFQSEIVVAPSQLDADPYLLATPEGTVDLRTGELRPANSADWITRCSPVIYDPEATSELWDKFIGDVTAQDGDLAAYLCRAAGYTLTADVKEESVFFMIGPPGSGKSTFLDAMLTVLGNMGMTLQGDTICGRGDSFPYSEVAELLGKRLAAVSEMSEGARLREAMVKQMSGGDKLVGRHLYKDRFEFETTHKLWIATNHLPRVFSTAMWRRIKTVPFKHKMTNPDYRFKSEAKEPTSDLAKAAFAWMVRGCLEWQKEGLGTCAAVQAETAEYREDEDRLGQFLAEECEMDPTSVVCTADLFDRWTGWCIKNGERPGTKNMFSRQVKERGTYERARDAKGRHGFAGLRLSGSAFSPTVN